MIPLGESHCPAVILFASYGSPGRGNAEFNPTKYFSTPVEFGPNQVVPMRVEDRADGNLHAGLEKIGVLLSETEAFDMMDRYAYMVSIRLSNDLKEQFYQVSGGHAGCLAALTRLLDTAPEFDTPRRKSSVFELRLAQEKLFNHPQRLFTLLKDTQFARGLPKIDVLQTPIVSSILKQAVGSNRVDASQFQTPVELEALELIWRNGWLDGANYHEYRFASFIHQWFCSLLLCKPSLPKSIPFQTPLDLAIAVIRLFVPSNLSDPPRFPKGMGIPLEDLFQKEFYRAFYFLVDGNALISPEFIAKSGKGGGGHRFSPVRSEVGLRVHQRWGFEFIRSGSNIVEHMGRFQLGGAYHSLIMSGLMSQYLVLDFRLSMPQKSRPEYRSNLYHIVFSSKFRDVSIVHAANLDTVFSFTLSENITPLL